MPGLFDGMRISKSGIMANRLMQEVIGNNIANASNDGYTRQQVHLTSRGAAFDGQHFIGQGVDTAEVVRVRDTLLDNQIRSSESSAENYQIQMQWLQKIESIYNEPSEDGVSASLSNFWEAWSELSNSPENIATRSNIISRTNSLTGLIKEIDGKLEQFKDEINIDLDRTVGEINGYLEEIAELNKNIFEVEASNGATANDLHDLRDVAIDNLSKLVNVSTQSSSNGMVNILIEGHPAVFEDEFESLELNQDPLNTANKKLYWRYGDAFEGASDGKIAGILNVRDQIIPQQQNDLDAFVSDLISSVNNVYANGVSPEGETLLESHLGYEVYGVDSVDKPLSIVPTGEHGSMHISFYNEEGDIVRSHGVVIDSQDSMSDIQDKLDNIQGLNVAILNNRLQLEFDSVGGTNALGETRFAISNNSGGHDTSGFLKLLGFDASAKSTNSSGSVPILASADLTELQTVLEEPDVAAVRSKALGLAGRFSINAFETGTEDTPKTNGYHVQQIAIDVVSTDSIDSIMAKINTHTANFGLQASFNGVTNKVEITSSASTDGEGNVVLAGGSHNLRLGFVNEYRYPANTHDEAPANYTSGGDTTGFFAKIQMNTLLEGKDASDISLDSDISNPSDVHAGHRLSSGSNEMAIEMASLQHKKVGVEGEFTIGELYEELIATMGTDVQQAESMYENEEFMRGSFLAEKDRISGVNLDEELSNMLLYQRSYEANARSFSTFDQMAQELLNLIR